MHAEKNAGEGVGRGTAGRRWEDVEAFQPCQARKTRLDRSALNNFAADSLAARSSIRVQRSFAIPETPVLFDGNFSKKFFVRISHFERHLRKKKKSRIKNIIYRRLKKDSCDSFLVEKKEREKKKRNVFIFSLNNNSRQLYILSASRGGGVSSLVEELLEERRSL